MSEQLLTNNESLSAEQRDAFLAFEQLCRNQLEKFVENIHPIVAESPIIGLESKITGRHLSISDGGEYPSYRYKIFASNSIKDDSLAYATYYTLTPDSVLRKKVFDNPAKLSDYYRRPVDGKTINDMNDDELIEEYGEIMHAEETYALIDELSRSAWDRKP